MPCLNSSGNVASDFSSMPSALRPFQVKATVTQRLSSLTESRTSAADCTVLRISFSHARPAEVLRNDRNSYRPVSAGVRVNRMCWMSSNSSILLTRSAFRPCPCCYAPPFGDLAKRHRKDRAALRDLLAAHVERHGRGNNNIRAVAGNVVVQRLT